jgi:biopolymer transport protein ExbB
MSLLLDWYSQGRPFTTFVLLAGIAGVVVLGERIYVLMVRSKLNGRVFMEKVIRLARSGKLDDALKLCAQSKAALSDMGLLILRSRTKDEAELQNVADAAALSLMPALTRRLGYLPVLAGVSAILGLLGTIEGARDTLTAAASMAVTDRSATMSAGLARALSSLAFGLAVAAPLWLAHAYLLSLSEAIIEQVHEFSARLINALIERPDVRLGHR